MSNALKIYGTRKCLVCQKTFEATWPAQVTCSETCRIARRRTLKRETHKRNNELLWENLEWLNCKLESMIFKHRQEQADKPVVQTLLIDVSQEKVPAVEEEANKASAKKYRHICANCGSTFKSTYKDDSYCCDQCAKESAACRIA